MNILNYENKDCFIISMHVLWTEVLLMMPVDEIWTQVKEITS